MTGDWKSLDIAAAQLGPGGGGDNPEACNVVFRNSYADKAIGWAPFGPANGKAYFFDFPSSASMSGTYSFCVESRDPSGNVSKPSCAPLVVF